MKNNSLLFHILLVITLTALSLPARADVDWSLYSWIDKNQCDASCLNKYKINSTSDPSPTNIQYKDSKLGIHMSFTNAISSVSLLSSGDYATEGAGLWVFLTALTAMETPVSVTCVNGNTYNFIIYYADGSGSGIETNNCSFTSGTAIDGTFSNDYSVHFDSDGNDVTVTFTFAEGTITNGYIHDYTNRNGGFTESAANVDGNEVSYTLTGYSAGQSVQVACKIGVEGGADRKTTTFSYQIGTPCNASDCDDNVMYFVSSDSHSWDPPYAYLWNVQMIAKKMLTIPARL